MRSRSGAAGRSMRSTRSSTSTGSPIKVRDKGAVTIKSAHLVIGVDVEGRKHALGCWIAETEGAKFWHSVLTQLRNRGLRDILIACCDGLTGLPDAITTVFPQTVVQTCVVHYADLRIMPRWSLIPLAGQGLRLARAA